MITYRWEAAADIAKFWIDAPESGTLQNKGTDCCLCLGYDIVHLEQRNMFNKLVQQITKVFRFANNSTIQST